MPGANFTHNAQRAILLAQKIAQETGEKQISALHLLNALLNQDSSIVLTILGNRGIDIEKLRNEVEKSMKKSSPVVSIEGEQVSQKFFLSQGMALILKEAGQEAERMGDDFISIEHLFLALFLVEGSAKAILENAQFLPPSKGGPEKEKEEGLNYDSVLRELEEIRGGEKVDDPHPEEKTQVIDKYTLNLTKLAKEGKLDPIIGREKETRRVMQVLSRRTKNNPVLIGEAGVGKTAIVEGLAQKIARKEVPESLKSKEVLSLDLGSLVAGTRYRGEFENRMKALLKAIKKEGEKYIIFIDELHTLVGAGAAEGSIDASNLLKPDLARGHLRAIGATTLKEYQKYIERDAALERRFQPVKVEESTLEETIFVLRGIKEKYELHHGVKIEDSALKAAAELSAKYVSDRFLPDKAVDLMDEAMSSLRLEVESEPSKLEDLKKRIQNLKIEEEALKSENGKEAERRKRAISRELADLKEGMEDLDSRWRLEKETIDKIKELKSKMDSLKYEAERAGQEADLQRVAEIKYGQLPSLQKEVKKEERKLSNIQKKRPVIKESVSEEDIAGVVSRWTGIPVSKLLEEEAKKLKRMEEIISKRIIGQEAAISAISNAIRRARAGISEESKPLGSFLFLGPTGVGKTETARALSHFLFNSEKALITLDMSEYMERHSVSKMIGSPPGYVGHEEAGQLTEKVRRNPYSVVLIDEVEKAHPEVFNILLQIFEDGRLTDTKGREVSFRNTIIIMTSNMGSEYITETSGLGFSRGGKEEEAGSIRERVMEAVKSKFRPELLNRIDEIVIFNHLGMKEVKQIVKLELEKIRKRVMENNRVKVKFKNSVHQILAEKGFSKDMRARPLKRTLQKEVLNPLAIKIISGEINSGEQVVVGVKGKELEFETPQRQKALVK